MTIKELIISLFFFSHPGVQNEAIKVNVRQNLMLVINYLGF